MSGKKKNKTLDLKPNTPIPAEVVFHPSWWHKNEGIIFDSDFFFHPAKRVEEELHMEKALYERWGQFGLGSWHERPRPILGPVHLAAGFLVSGMLGCNITFQPDGSPQVEPVEDLPYTIDVEAAFRSDPFRKLCNLAEALTSKFGYLLGDVDWNGILNIALDLYGQKIFLEMVDKPSTVEDLFGKIAAVEERFFRFIQKRTGSTSIAVNRSIMKFSAPILLHSHCSHTMISEEHYRRYILPFDIRWALRYPPFGVHFCGPDPHRFLSAYREIPALAFLDVGWGADIAKIRRALPQTFLNIRLDPTRVVRQTAEEITRTVSAKVQEAVHPYRTGVCCINIDDTATEEQITAIFATAVKLRRSSAREVS